MTKPIQKRVYLDEQDAVPLDEVINSIENADIIIMGPGSFIYEHNTEFISKWSSLMQLKNLSS